MCNNERAVRGYLDYCNELENYQPLGRVSLLYCLKNMRAKTRTRITGADIFHVEGVEAFQVIHFPS